MLFSQPEATQVTVPLKFELIANFELTANPKKRDFRGISRQKTVFTMAKHGIIRNQPKAYTTMAWQGKNPIRLLISQKACYSRLLFFLDLGDESDIDRKS